MSKKKDFFGKVKQFVLLSPPILMAGIGLACGTYFYNRQEEVIDQFTHTSEYQQSIQQQSKDLNKQLYSNLISREEYDKQQSFYNSRDYTVESILKSDLAAEYRYYNNNSVIFGTAGMVGILGVIPYFMTVGQYAFKSEKSGEVGNDEAQSVENLSSQASC